MQNLCSKILHAGDGEPYTIPLRKELDEDTGVLYFRVARDNTEPTLWGLVIGDALHNFRSALDSAWWQLAIAHLGRVPTEKEATKIQFPITKPGGKFHAASIRRWVGERATTFAEEAQPPPGSDLPNGMDALALLRRMSNVDKHRNLNVALHVHGGIQVQFRLASRVPKRPSTALEGAFFHAVRPDGPQVGDTLLTVPPGCWIRQPDVQFDAFQEGFISVDRKLDIRFVLQSIHDFVDTTMTAVGLLLEGEEVTVERPRVPVPDQLPFLPEGEAFEFPKDGGHPKPLDD